MTTVVHYLCAHSLYTWLGIERLIALGRQYGFAIEHRPIDLHTVMEAAGSTRFEERSRAHLRYFFSVEAARWADFRVVEWMGRIPTHHMKSYDLANRVLIAADTLGLDVGAVAAAVLRAHWVDDADLSDTAVLQSILETASYPASALLERAQGDGAAQAYSANTQAAIDASVFGAPTYVLGEEMFYGQDRLELLAWRLEQRRG